MFDVEFRSDSEALLERLRRGALLPVVSELTEAELLGAPGEVQGVLDELLELGAENVQLTGEAEALAAAYLEAKVVTQKYEVDALHIALATVAKVDVLLSWNFKHIVNLQRITRV